MVEYTSMHVFESCSSQTYASKTSHRLFHDPLQLPRSLIMLTILCDLAWSPVPFGFENQFQLAQARWPSEYSTDWAKSQHNLVDRLEAIGWGGLGLWHHAVTLSNASGSGTLTSQLAQLGAAGVLHVKVDGTDVANGNVTRCAKDSGSGVIIEHKLASGKGPVNGDIHQDGRASFDYIQRLSNLLARTDVLRTDDIICQMSVPTCLERMSRVLAYVSTNLTDGPAITGARGVVAPQDEAYLAAGLSGALAAMRHPLPQLVGDTRLNGNRNLSRRIDEITRTVMWNRLVPPTGAWDYPTSAAGQTLVDPTPLTDVMTLTADDTWYKAATGKPIFQGAPSRTARGLPQLPTVVATDARYPHVAPFVVASKAPNGGLAVAALGRTLEEYHGWIMCVGPCVPCACGHLYVTVCMCV
eukprot:m.234533 g.234533  ORF g.234533 m.234533 type:complete len:412 (-) comp19324_c0_seq1:1167-2402(-)